MSAYQRKKLEKINNLRDVFSGIFERYGSKGAFKGPDLVTILLKNIKDKEGNLVSDHLWFNETLGFKKLSPLKPGTILEFRARVKPYEKGYINRREGFDFKTVDYKLSHPTKIQLINNLQSIAVNP